MRFTPEQLFEILTGFGRAAGYRVAYSGGLDSHVLLHAMALMRDRLGVAVSAVHVNHGLSPAAAEWARHCRRVCGDLGMELQCFDIDAAAPAGASPESWARKRRYEVLAGGLAEDEILLTAHQADDQAETLLLQLLRGSGPAGLAAMPAIRVFGRGHHARPLLSFERQALEEYARDKGLAWIEDESNADPRYDRNYLRNRVVPLLRQRWPAATPTLAHDAALQAETSALLEQLAELDLADCCDPATDGLAVAPVMALPVPRRRNLLRRWLQRQGFRPPDRRRLQAIIREVLGAREDASPCVSWAGVEVRRHGGRLYASAPMPQPLSGEMAWDTKRPLSLPLGELSAETVTGAGLRADACQGGVLRVGFRSGGERIRWPNRDHHRPLKKLFQEHGIAPWLRAYVPLLIVDGHLVSVAGVWTEPDWVAGPAEAGLRIHWTESGRVFNTH